MPQLSRTPKLVLEESGTHHGTASGITDHEYLTGRQFMEVRQVRTMHCGGLRFSELQTLSEISIGWNTDRKDRT